MGSQPDVNWTVTGWCTEFKFLYWWYTMVTNAPNYIYWFQGCWSRPLQKI